jgi:hypothetical protein
MSYDRQRAKERRDQGWWRLRIPRGYRIIVEGARVPEHTDPIRQLMGDPPPGMSALDQKQREAET